MRPHTRKPFEGATPSGWRWVILAGCVLGLVSAYLSATTAWRTAFRPRFAATVAVTAAPPPAIASSQIAIPATQPATLLSLAATLPAPEHPLKSTTSVAAKGSTATQPATASRPVQPGPNYIWVEGYRRSDGTYVKGYWRATSRK